MGGSALSPWAEVYTGLKTAEALGSPAMARTKALQGGDRGAGHGEEDGAAGGWQALRERVGRLLCGPQQEMVLAAMARPVAAQRLSSP